MYVRKVKNKMGKPMYLLIDDDNNIVKDVYKYILHLARIDVVKTLLKTMLII